MSSEADGRREALLQKTTGSLVQVSSQPVVVLRAGLEAERWADRLRAAQLVLTMASRYRGELELERRLAALETGGESLEDAAGESDD